MAWINYLLGKLIRMILLIYNVDAMKKDENSERKGYFSFLTFSILLSYLKARILSIFIKDVWSYSAVSARLGVCWIPKIFLGSWQIRLISQELYLYVLRLAATQQWSWSRTMSWGNASSLIFLHTCNILKEGVLCACVCTLKLDTKVKLIFGEKLLRESYLSEWMTNEHMQDISKAYLRLVWNTWHGSTT